MSRFSKRSTLPELMDDPAQPAEVTRQSLREIETINRLLGGYSVTTAGLTALGVTSEQSPIRVVDVGCGGGDGLRHLAQWALTHRVNLKLVGVDWNPVMVVYARERSQIFPEIQFMQANLWDDTWLEPQPDVVVMGLFAHHFDEGQIQQLVKRCHQVARLGVVINDLHRHPLAYHSIRLLTRLLSRSVQVRYDAPLSVLRGFSRADWHRIMTDVGISRYSLRWRWAFRWQLVISK